LAAKRGELDVLQKIWEWAKENVTKEEINNKLLLATDICGKTIFHTVARRTYFHVILEVWEWAKENLTKEEINNKLLLATDNLGKTAWHLVAETLYQAEGTLTTEETRDYYYNNIIIIRNRL
jgi:hypothetical protein